MLVRCVLENQILHGGLFARGLGVKEGFATTCELCEGNGARVSGLGRLHLSPPQGGATCDSGQRGEG